MRILVGCGAGASSTFVAQRMRVTLAARGLDIDVVAGSDSDLDARLGDPRLGPVDVLLVGPHLAPQYEQICELAARYGVSARLLPAEVFSIRNGDASVDLALQGATSSTTPSTSTAHHQAPFTPKETLK